jgi:hypothetical protein
MLLKALFASQPGAKQETHAHGDFQEQDKIGGGRGDRV